MGKNKEDIKKILGNLEEQEGILQEQTNNLLVQIKPIKRTVEESLSELEELKEKLMKHVRQETKN